MPSPDDRPDLRSALDSVPDPITGAGLIASGRSGPPRLDDKGVVSLMIDATGLDEEQRGALTEAARTALLPRPGVREVRVLMTAERRHRRVLAVGSGKGGVGKSTVAANLAVAFARRGLRVGLVDADIYGPSQPRLLGTEGQRPTAREQVMNPVPTGFGVAMLSIGQLVEPGRAIAWRGPMAAGALGQMMDANWGEADLLVVDLPPGTGDVQLTMIQKHRPDAALIVSTPQDLALIDAARAIDLFAQANVPVVGMVENMSGYRCPHCGEVSDPFGHGGTEAEALRLGMPFLGRIPLAIDIRRASDAGSPPATRDDEAGAPFLTLANTLAEKMNLTPV